MKYELYSNFVSFVTLLLLLGMLTSLLQSCSSRRSYKRLDTDRNLAPRKVYLLRPDVGLELSRRPIRWSVISYFVTVTMGAAARINVLHENWGRNIKY